MRFRQAVPGKIQPVGKAGKQPQSKVHECIASHAVEKGKLAGPADNGLGIGRIGVRQLLESMQGLVGGHDHLEFMNDLARAFTQDVGADNPAVPAAEDLGHADSIAVDERPAHGIVSKTIDAKAAPVSRIGFLFGQADPGQGRFGEDDIYVMAVIDGSLHGQEGIGRRDDALDLCRRRELVRARDVAAGYRCWVQRSAVCGR